MVTSYFGPTTKLIYAIGAVVALIGGVKIHQRQRPAGLVNIFS